MKLLFVCSRNRWRSPTAEALCRRLHGYSVRSAGTSSQARVRVTAGHIGWADVIFVMEKRHALLLRRRFPDALSGKRTISLDVPDEFGFMDPELVALLQVGLAEHLDVEWPVAAPENR